MGKLLSHSRARQPGLKHFQLPKIGVVASVALGAVLAAVSVRPWHVGAGRLRLLAGPYETRDCDIIAWLLPAGVPLLSAARPLTADM
jgi:hypothetical protein